MSSKKSLAARLLTRAFRPRPTAPLVRPTGPVGGRIEELEDRSVPALVSFYQAEGNATDAQALNPGSLVNGVAFGPGVVGQAFSFNGLNSTSASQVTVPPAASLDFATGTVTCYFNAPTDSANRGILSMRTDVSSTGTRWSIHVNENANTVGIYNGFGFQTVAAPAINPGTWYHLAAVMTPTTTTFYLNGVSLGSTTNGINPLGVSKPFVIGTPNDPGFTNENFGGQIDEVRVFNHALTPAEVVATMTTGTINASLTGGVLTVTDVNGTRNNAITASVSGSNLVLTEAAEPFTSTGTSTYTIPLASVGSLAFNLAGGNDAVTLDYTNGVLPNVTFDGGAGGNDGLAVKGGGVRAATYTPSVASTAANKQGTVVVTGGGTSTVTFSNLEPLDVTGMTTATLAPAGAADVLTLTNGTDFLAGGTNAAIRVSGTTGGAPIETAAFWNNTNLVIDTVTGGSDGNDTVTVTSANNAHANTNIAISTGTGTDAVNVNGPMAFTGAISITTFSVQGSGAISTNGGLTVTNANTAIAGANGFFGQNGSDFLTGAITGTGALVKKGVGFIGIGNSALSGGNTISAGSLYAGRNGSVAGTVTLGDASTGANNVAFYVYNPVQNGGSGVMSNPIVVSALGSGTATISDLGFTAGLLTYTGSITLNRPTTINSGTNNSFRWLGQITGPVGTLTITNTNVNIVEFQNSTNNFVGNVVVTAGTNFVDNTDGSGGSIPVNSSVTVNGTFSLNGFSQTIDALNGSGTVGSFSTGVNTLTVGGNGGSGAFSGTIQNGSGTTSLVKAGAGTQTLTGLNFLYTGTTTINGGTLLVNGTLTNGPAATDVTVNSGGTLGGTGTVNGVTLVNSGGTIAPGTSPGILNSGGVNFASGSNFSVELNGLTVGTQYDQLNVTGGVTIDGGNLVVALGFTPVNGNSFTIINNDLSDAVTVTNPFRVAGTPIPEGGTFTVGATTFVLTYAGGTNANDVVLTVQNASLSAALAAGTLTITDTTGVVNTITASVSGTNLVLTDAAEQFQSAPAGGALSNGNKTLTIPLASVTSLVLSLAGGNDAVTLDHTGGQLPNVSYDGGAGANDILSVKGTTAQAATYTPSSASTAANKQGTVRVVGTGTTSVTFSNLEPVDVSGFGTATLGNGGVSLAATNVFTIANGTAFGSAATAIRVSGTTGGSPIETVAFFNNTTVSIDTGGVAGSTDTFTVTGANATAAGITNLTLTTGANSGDAITVSGAVTAAGTVTMTAGQNVLVNAAVSGGAGVSITGGSGAGAFNTKGVTVTANVSSASGAVTLLGTGGTSGASNYGVWVTGSGVTVSGVTTSVTGFGGATTSVNGQSQIGVVVDSAGKITSASGAVTVSGTGASTAAVSGTGFNYGVWVAGAGSQITSGGGNVSVTGVGRAGAGGDTYGVRVEAGAGAITSGGSGTVSVDGSVTGALPATMSATVGVILPNPGSTITSGGAGTVTVTGTAGSGNAGPSLGVYALGSGTGITSGGGAVSVTGVGGSGGAQNYGVLLQSTAFITSPAALTVTGTKGTVVVEGVYIQGGTITSTGLATLSGLSGSNVVADAASTVNFGSLTVTTTGSADITEDSSTSLAGGSVGGTFLLTAAGGIAQTAAVTAGTLTASNSGSGNIDLSIAGGNPITSFSATNTVTGGTVNVRFSTAGTITGITTTGGAATATNAAGALNLAGNITTTGGTNGGNVQLTSTNALTLGTSVTINTDHATGTDGSVTLSNSVNATATGQSFTVTAGGGAVSLQGVGASQAIQAVSVTGGAVSVAGSVGAATGGISLSGTTISLAGPNVRADRTANTAAQATAAGPVTITGAVTLTGVTTVSAAGSTTGAAVTFAAGSSVDGGQTLTLNAGTANVVLNNTTFGQTTPLTSLSLTGAAATGIGNIATTGGVTVVTTGASSLGGVISGSGGLTQGLTNGTTTASVLTLSGANTYTGQTIVNAGAVAVGSSTALGATGAGNETVVNFNTTVGGGTGTSLIVSAAGLTVAESLTLSSNTTGDRRASLRNTSTSGTNTWSGPITLTGTGGTQLYIENAGNMTVTGGVGVSAFTGGFTVRGAGGGSGSFTTTPLNLGTTGFTRTDSALWSVAVAGNTWGGTQVSTGELRMGVVNALPAATTVTMGQTGTNSPTLNLNGFSQTIAALRNNPSIGAGTMLVTSTAGTPTLTISGSTTETYGTQTTPVAFTATIGGSLALTRAGTGTTDLFGANTYTGATTVSGGRLNVNGSTAAGSAVTVSGGTLGGTGTVNGTVGMSSGTVAPGLSPGVVTTGSVALTGGTYQVEIGGNTPGNTATNHDQLIVTGTVALGNGTTALSLLGAYVPLAADNFTIIANDGTADSTTGYFTGLPEGTAVTFNGRTLYITYNGGDGNDVVLGNTPVINGTTGADTFVFRQVSGSPGNYEISTNGSAFGPLGPITSVVINGGDGNDTLTIDSVNGNPFLTGGITYNGGTQTGTPGDTLRVSTAAGGAVGTYTTITHNFLTGSSGNVNFDGRVVNYTGLEPVLVNVGSVTDVIFNLPAAASTAVLEDDGASGNTLSRLRSTNGTFEATTFSNPTGSVTINRGNAADTLSTTALPDLTSTLTIGSGANPFATVTVGGAFTPAANKNLTATASGTISLTAAANVATTGTGSVSLTTATDIGLATGSVVSTVNGGVTLSANAAGATAGNFNGIVVLGTVTTTGTGGISMTGRGGNDAATAHHAGIWVISGGVVRSTGTGAGSGGITFTGQGGAGTNNNDGVIVEGAGSTVTSVAGAVALTGTSGAGSANFNIGVLVFSGGQVTSTGTGAAAATITLNGTGGSGTNDNYGVNVDTATVSSVDGAVQLVGVATDMTGTNQDGVRLENTATVAVTGTGTLTLTGTAGNATGFGVHVIGSSTLTAAGLATLNGPSASNIAVDASPTVNFGNLTVNDGGATATIFEDSGTAVNLIFASTINLTSAGAITDNNAGAINLAGSTATLAAAGGIDLDTSLGTLIATTSAAGAIVIRELDAITLTNVSSFDGNITITAGGAVTAVNVVDALDAAHVVSITTTAGNILVGFVSATGDTVTLNSAAAIEELGPPDATTDIVGGVLNLTAVTGIGALGAIEIDTITTLNRGLTASVTGTGLINLADTAGGLRVRSATTANGSITITAVGGDMIVETVTAGTASAVNLSTTTSGNILDDASNATRVTGGTVTLTSVGTIGNVASGDVDTAATNLVVAAAGTASVNELDGVNVDSAAVGANVFELATAGTTTQGPGVISASGFRFIGSGVATLTGANTVTTFAANRTGDLTFANVGNLTIGTVTGFTGTTVGIVVAGTTTISTTNGTSSALLTVANAVSGSGNIVLSSDQDYTQNLGVIVASSGGSVTINADVVADLDTTGATVNINGPVTSGLVAANSVTINTGGDADTITVRQTGTSNLDVFAGGIVAPAVGFDQVTVVYGSLGTGFVRLNNSGSDNYRATVDGAAQVVPLTFHANTQLNTAGTGNLAGFSGPRLVSVNAATVLSYVPAGPTLNVLTLLGGTAADAYFVQFTDPAVPLSLLPPLVNVNANGASDTANVYGTNSGDTIGVNEASSDQVTSAGVTVQYDGALETLNVFAKDEPNVAPPTATFGDTINLRPDTLTAINVTAGPPTLYPGDTLNLDVVPYVLNNPTFTPPLPLPDGQIAFTGGGAAQTVTWTSIENFPVPLGMGGSFDFEATRNASRPFGYRSVIPSDNYTPAIGFGWDTPLPQYGIQVADVGPATVVGNGDTVFGPLSSPLGMLYRDYAYGWNSAADNGIFRVAVIPNKPVQVTAYLGAPTVGRDGQVVEWSNDGSNWFLVPSLVGVGSVSTLPGETITAGGVVTPNGTSLYVRFRDIGGGEPYWSVAGLDVRPTNTAPPTGTGALVAPLPIRQEFSTATPLVAPPAPGVGFASGQAFAAVDADGVTIDYYRGKDAIPNSILTITASNGTLVDGAFTAADGALGTRVLNGDVASYITGFQVQADGNGEFTFGVRRPTGTATSTIQITDATGFRADRFTQAFQLPAARRIDFGPLPAASTADYGNGGTVQSYLLPAPANAFSTGYLPFATATYSPATGLGWSSATPLPVAFTPGGTGATALQTDGVYGGYAPSEFVLDVPGTNYVVTATLGDLSARRDDMFVEVLTGSGWVFAKGFNPATGAYDLNLNGLTSPTGVSPNAGQTLARSFLAAAVGGQVRVRFGNVTGNPYWTLSSLEVRPTQAALAVTAPGGTLPANGITASNFTVNTAAVPNGTLLTVRVGAGQVVGTDQSSTYDGFQILSTGASTTISVVAPDSAAAITSFLEVETLTGEARGAASQAYSGVAPAPTGIQRFDFNGPTGTTATGVTAVRGNLLQSTSGAPVPAYPSNPVNVNYGWSFPVGEFDRDPATLPASMTADQKALFQDGASLNATKATFRVKVGAGQYGVRYYIGDSAKKWPWIQIQVEGQNSTPVASTGQLKTNLNQYWSYVLQGSDVAGPGGVGGPDGYLDISIFGANVWVLNGLDVAAGGIASLPPSLFAPSPQRAAFQVTSGTAAKLTTAQLKPIIAEAVSRWTAAGADPARLMGVTVSITDLNDVGRLGEHVPGSVHIDDDAGGRGWFVDATPGDDAEFGAAVAVGLGATDGAAARGVDLLTVVMHELGHELGLDDVDPAAAPADLMAETLDVGVRRLPVGRPATIDLPAAKIELPAAKIELPARPAVALWLDKAETVSSRGALLAATADAVKVVLAEPTVVRTEPVKLALPPATGKVAAWPDADALLDLDGVYVG